MEFKSKNPSIKFNKKKEYDNVEDFVSTCYSSIKEYCRIKTHGVNRYEASKDHTHDVCLEVLERNRDTGRVGWPYYLQAVKWALQKKYFLESKKQKVNLEDSVPEDSDLDHFLAFKYNKVSSQAEENEKLKRLKELKPKLYWLAERVFLDKAKIYEVMPIYLGRTYSGVNYYHQMWREKIIPELQELLKDD